jgi:hypothetical protein
MPLLGQRPTSETEKGDEMPIDPEELKQASNKLEYHVKGYAQTFLWLRDWRLRNLPSSLKSNSILDSHLIHARLLIFFLMTKSQSTDVNASDFLDDPSAFKPLNNSTLDEWRQKINVRHAHLTAKNLTELISDFKWDIGEIARNLVPLLLEFFEEKTSPKISQVDRDSCQAQLGLVKSLVT